VWNRLFLLYSRYCSNENTVDAHRIISSYLDRCDMVSPSGEYTCNNGNLEIKETVEQMDGNVYG